VKRKQILSVLFLAAAVMALEAQPASAQSVGGSQSERSGSDTQTPLSKGSRSAGADPRKGGQGPRSAFESQGMGQQDVRLAQETLKNQGHDPGWPPTGQATASF